MNAELQMFDAEETDFLPSSKAQIIGASVRVAKVKSEFVLMNDIVRFQFLEYLLRCAIKKYFESGACETEVDAVRMFIVEHIDKHVGTRFDQTLWRQENTMNIYVDNVLKAHMKVWDHMYNKYSGRHALPGMKAFMMVDEFDDWVQQSNLLNDLMTAKNISYVYNVSMLSQEDEVKTGAHLKATVLEFTEMICRVCAEASFPPPARIDENGEEV